MGTSFGRWMIFIVSMLAIGLCDYAKGQSITVKDTKKMYNWHLVNMKKVSQEGVGRMLMPQGAYSDGFSELVEFAKQNPDTNHTVDLDILIPGHKLKTISVRLSYVPEKGFSMDDCRYYNFDVDILYCQTKLLNQMSGDY